MSLAFYNNSGSTAGATTEYIFKTDFQWKNKPHTKKYLLDYFTDPDISLENLGPRLVWLSGLSASLPTKRLPVRFPVRAHAWVEGQVPSWGRAGGNQSMYLSHIDASQALSFFLPLYLQMNK